MSSGFQWDAEYERLTALVARRAGLRRIEAGRDTDAVLDRLMRTHRVNSPAAYARLLEQDAGALEEASAAFTIGAT